MAAGLSPYAVTVGHFNADAFQDLAVANIGSSSVSIFLGTGTGAFGAASSVPVGSSPSDVVLGDFNGDSVQDLVVAGGFDQTILQGNGSGGFTRTAVIPGTNGLERVAVGDFDEDGRQDVAAVSEGGSSPVRIFLRACIPPETDAALSGGDLTVTDISNTSNDGLNMSVSGADLRITDPNNVINCMAGTQVGPNTCDVPLSTITGMITVNTGGGDDALTLNLVNGDFIPTGGLTFNGGGAMTL